MVVIPVVWWSSTSVAIARGYWDQAALEALFAGESWKPARGYDFSHHVLTENHENPPVALLGEIGKARGCILVVPARHHVDRPHPDLIRTFLARCPAWAIVVLTGDEEHAFDWRWLDNGQRRFWVMTPGAGHGELRHATFLGSGYHPDTRTVLATGEASARARDRALDWFFAGQITHSRRQECAEALRELDGGELVETDGFTKGLPPAEYLLKMASAKIAPCPSGPCSPDTFRAWEALEAGCLPLVDGQTPAGEEHDFWVKVAGGNPPPFPIIDDWSRVSQVIAECLRGWPANANRAQAWWQRRQRDLAVRMRDDIQILSHKPGREDRMLDRLGVLITLSPSPAHPGTEIIEETVESIRERLPDSEIVIVCDGVRAEQQHLRKRYEEHLRKLLWLTGHRWRNVLPVLLDEHHHQARATATVIGLLETPSMLFVEHDTPLIGEVDFDGLCRLTTSAFDVVRLYHEATIHPDHAHLMLDAEPKEVDGVPVLRTYQWSQRPHVANTGYYRRMLERYFAPEARTMIEDCMYGIVGHAWREYGLAGWERFRLGVYAPGEMIKRSTHLDARGTESKFDMVMRYPGDAIPEGAPR